MAGALLPEPAPLAAVVAPEQIELAPDDLPFLLSLLPQADLYLQDEVQLALHPTLTRTWCRRGRRGQRKVAAPGDNSKAYGFGLVDWRDGWFDDEIADRRRAAPFCAQVTRAVNRSRARGRVAIVLCDNLGTHTARRSRLVRELLATYEGELYLVYTPPYDPDANRIEWLWRATRREVTHNHRHTAMSGLIAAAETHFHRLQAEPAAVLRQIGSPGVTLPLSAVPLKAAA